MAMSIRPSQPRRLHLASSLHNAVQSQSLPSLCRVSVGLPGPHQKAPAPPNALWLVLFLDLPRLVLPISFREPTVGSASMQRTFTQLEHSSNARSRPAVLIRGRTAPPTRLLASHKTPLELCEEHLLSCQSTLSCRGSGYSQVSHGLLGEGRGWQRKVLTQSVDLHPPIRAEHDILTTDNLVTR